jgi:Acetyltransferase (GNAT) domain
LNAEMSPQGIDRIAETSVDSSCDWFEHCFGHTGENFELFLPEIGRDPAALVRFEIARRFLFCQVGAWTPARFPLRVARFSGNTPQVPDKESIYDRLFRHFLTRELDAIYVESVKPETLLWWYLQRSPLIQKSFRFCSRKGPKPHWLIRLDGKFSNYLNRFSSKTRKNRLREIRILRDLGEVKLVRVTEASGVDAFLKAAYGISQQTRQFKRFGWGIAACDPRLVKTELLRLARQGWLRSYLLTCRDSPCSFILGQQCGDRFYPVAAGVNPAWRNYGVGTVLLLLALEDLFQHNSPDFYDLGGCVKHKEYLATDSYLEANVWLFRRRLYPALAGRTYSICNAMSRFGGSALERLGLKARATQLMGCMNFITASTASGAYPETRKWHGAAGKMSEFQSIAATPDVRHYEPKALCVLSRWPRNSNFSKPARTIGLVKQRGEGEAEP